MRSPGKAVWITALASAMAVSSVMAFPSAQAATSVTTFATSFEPSEPQPTWVDTVEVLPNGGKKALGVDGQFRTGIPGNIMEKVTEIKASGEFTEAGEVKENLADGDVNTKWLVFASTGWVSFKLSEPVAVVHYALSSANDEAPRDPRDWNLQGSQDGTTWTTIDSQTDQVFPERFQTKEYRFANTTAYLYYRIDITRNGGVNIVQLAELQLSNGDTTPPPASDMRTRVGKGPRSSPTAKGSVGYTGLQALEYSGAHKATGRGYSYNKLFDVDIAVTPTTELSYLLFPEMPGGDLSYRTTYAAVDLAFSDGTYLSDLNAVDHHGAKLSPTGQGDSKTVYVNQWNHKVSNIGAVAAGKTIDRILLAYDNPKGTGVFRGWVDDVRITDAPPVRTFAKKSDYALTTRGTQSTGSFSRGNNFPATAVPHGFNFWTPMTNAGSQSWLYEYHKANNAANLPTLQAFAISHEPSPWMGDRQTFQVMPSVATGTPDPSRTVRALPFKHENEIAKPHHYGVTFENGLRTDIAPTDHAALMRFTFPGGDSSMIFDNVNNNGGLTIDAATRSISGYSDVKSGLSTGATRMFVYATFDAPVTASGMLPGSGRPNTGYVRLDAGADRTVNLRIATSLLSVAQAKKNLELEISAGDTFESVRDRAQTLWEEKLGIIEVEGASPDQLTTLYSNLYRLFLYPNSGYENTGTAAAPVYKYASPVSPAAGADTPTQTGAKIVAGKVFVNNGFWDTYRTTWPAYALLTPREAGEMVDGFVEQYREGGWVARWSSPGYANLMTGTSSDVAFADAYLKGVPGLDVPSTYAAAVRNATVTPPNDNVGRKGLASSVFLGYTPTSTGEGMSWALEGYVNDYGIANMAQKLYESAKPTDPNRQRYKEEAEYFRNRSQNYVHMFDPRIDFFQGRNADGTWRHAPADFEPRDWGGDYTETNAWNMAFTVPHDGAGLANLYGGRAGLAKKLDTFFATPETGLFPGEYGGVIHEMTEARDVRMGQYGHSNQPSHHIISMYNYVGQPWKTQAKTREALSRLYLGSEIGQGYAGDEDNGEMSAWQLFGALGFYPLQMGAPTYAIGSPLFTKATVHLQNGRKLVVNAPKNSASNVYVQGLSVDGKPWNKSYLTHSQLADGAVLDFEMGSKPSTWASTPDAAPPSVTSGSQPARPLADLTGVGRGTPSGPAGVEVAPLFDNSSSTRVTFPSATPFVQYSLAAADSALFYTLTSGAVAGDPMSWVLKGSHDGSAWSVLDRRTNETFPWRLQTRPFKIEKPGRYAHYRLEVTASTGATTTLAEVELLGKPKAAPPR